MPPQGESNYPRAYLTPPYGTADQLDALGYAYYGLNTVFLINLLLFIGALSTAGMNNVAVFWAAMLLMVLLVGWVSLKYTKKLAFGLNWVPAGAWVCTVILALGVGSIITYIVLQMVALQEIKRYDIRSGAFGMKKKEYRAVLAARRAYEASIPSNAVTSPGFSVS